MYMCSFEQLFLVAQKNHTSTRSYEQGPREVQPAKPSWKVYFETFIANLEVALGHYIMLQQHSPL